MITYFVSGVCMLVYVLQNLGTISYSQFAIVPSLVRSGQFYRLFTGAIMHASLYHIMGNLGAFINVGTFIEKMYGKRRYIIILLASLLGSGLLVTFLGGNSYTVGLSGVVWGVFGAYASYLYKNDGRFDANERNQLMRMLLPNIIISLMPGVSWQGHLGGFVAGLIVSFILPLKYR